MAASQLDKPAVESENALFLIVPNIVHYIDYYVYKEINQINGGNKYELSENF